MSERSAVWIRCKHGVLQVLVEERNIGPDLISVWNLAFETSRHDLKDFSRVVKPEEDLQRVPIGKEYNPYA